MINTLPVNSIPALEQAIKQLEWIYDCLDWDHERQRMAAGRIGDALQDIEAGPGASLWRMRYAAGPAKETP